MKWLSFLFILLLASFALAEDEAITTESEAQTDQETKTLPPKEVPAAFKKFELRINPLILAIPGNADLGFYFSPQISVGPSYFSAGGCANIGLSANPGSRCNTWSAFGVRGNYYSNSERTRHGFYVGSGIYNVTKNSEFRYGTNNILKGQFSAPAMTAVGGYYFQAISQLSFYIGLGSLLLLNKPDEMTVSEGGVQTKISTESSTAFLYELGINYRF